MVSMMTLCPDKPGLVQHECPRYGIIYVSNPPSDEDGYVVPGCGCQLWMLVSPGGAGQE